MDMYNLCVKIEWEQTRQLSTGVTVPTGCEVRIYTWRLLMGLVMISIGGQVFDNFWKVNIAAVKIKSFSDFCWNRQYLHFYLHRASQQKPFR